MRQSRIAVGDCGDERLDNFGLDAIGEVTKSATSANLRQRSEVSLSLASVLVMRVKRRKLAPSVAASALAAVFPDLRVRIHELAEQRLKRQALAFEIEPERRHRVVEQAVPCGGGAHRLVEEQSLEVIGKLVRLLLADVLEPRAIMAERRRRHRRRST